MATLKEVKTKFTEITGMEAVKKSVLKVCDGFEARTMKSIHDWQCAIDSIQIQRTDKYQQEVVEKLNKEIEFLQASVDDLEKENQELTETIDVLENEKIDLQFQIEDLKQEVDALSANSDEYDRSFSNVNELLINFEGEFILLYFKYILEHLRGDDLKKTYRSLSRLYHPDSTVLDKEKANKTFQLLNEVYEYVNEQIEIEQNKFNNGDIDLFGTESNSRPATEDEIKIHQQRMQKIYETRGFEDDSLESF